MSGNFLFNVKIFGQSKVNYPKKKYFKDFLNLAQVDEVIFIVSFTQVDLEL